MHILCFSVMQAEARDLKTELRALEVLCCVSPESNTHILYFVYSAILHEN